jgi:hypothetical protein
VRTDKGFKEVHLNQVAKAIQEFCGNDVTGHRFTTTYVSGGRGG